MPSIQFGLRLNRLESMQWNGGRVYFEGRRRSYVDTSAGSILEVWPGPVPGSFAVRTDQGLGVLMGSDVMVLRATTAEEVIRSSDPEIVFVARPDSDGGTQIVTVALGGEERLAFRFSGPIVDFDVDRTGRVVLLDLRGGLHEAQPGEDPQQLRLPAIPHASRVFLASQEAEIFVLAAFRLCRSSAEAAVWACEEVRPSHDALVRHAWSRRVVREPRFTADLPR